MMANLFASFNPTTIIMSLNWASSLLIFLVIPPMYWVIPSRLNMLWISVMMILHKEFKVLIKHKDFNGSTLIFCSLFMFIMFNNFMGLFPYIFTSSSHMNFTLALSLPLWLSFNLYGWIKNTKHMFAHLVPQGAPNVLLPFLVIVESISSVIRPGTLAIRLSANMIAGHLLMTLMGNSGPSLSMILLQILIISQMLLLILESAVAIIQAYVFSILSTLYSSEIK
uniref:ATP synthase subunit a n=1 Tax=Cryptorhynchinae sp. 4 ACP-2013 TaxID=1434465 RepID=A0A3G3MEG4_9CUCU|nr:ATP synthase F0 subunit 6 [Cryptorhynchinae sp. 4 ACP-2013]